VVEESQHHLVQIGVHGLQRVNQLVHQYLVDLPAQTRIASPPPGSCNDVEPAIQRSVETGYRVGLELDERLAEIRLDR